MQRQNDITALNNDALGEWIRLCLKESEQNGTNIEDIAEEIAKKLEDQNISIYSFDSFINLLNRTPYIFLKFLSDSFKENRFLVFDIYDNTQSFSTKTIFFRNYLDENHSQKSSINREDIELRSSIRKMRTKEQNNKITIYTSNNQNFLLDTFESFILDATFSITYDVREEINNIYYLPASRSGLYQALSAFGQIIAELSKSRKFTTKKVELPSISEPLSDYFLELSNIKVRKKEIQNRVTKIANQIENSILNGKIEFDNESKKIMFRPNGTDLKLDLSYTSSMVSEVSPIIL